jgi:hypothetical protein
MRDALMSGQSGEEQRRQPYDQAHRYQHPQAHPQSSPPGASGASGGSGSKDPKKDSRSFGERINTTQGILTIVVSLITLGGAAAVVVKHFASHASLSSQTLTVDQVRSALLTSSDLAIIDKNLASGDLQYPASGKGSCKPITVKNTIGLSRTFLDKSNISNILIMGEEVGIYNSPSDAHIAISEASQAPACSFADNQQFSVSNIFDISNRLAGMCTDAKAWEITVNDNNVTFSVYYGMARCGRAVVTCIIEVPQGSLFDNAVNLVECMGLAVPKIEQLPSI